MGWQELAALTIVAVTAVAFVWSRFLPQKFSLRRDANCGCEAGCRPGSSTGIVFRARKGEQPEVLLK